MEQSPVETKPKKSAWRKARGAKKNGGKERRKARQRHEDHSSEVARRGKRIFFAVFARRCSFIVATRSARRTGGRKKDGLGC